MNLEKKNILFISPEFFEIDASIIKELENRGANVTWVDERSVKSSIGRALNSVTSAPFYFQSNKYYSKKLNDIAFNVDIVLVIKGEMITKKTIELIRCKWPETKLLLYFYDPVVNIKGILKKTKLYDRVISFEPKDCEKYGFEFRPLFSDFENNGSSDIRIDNIYDACFYGTMYGDRFEVVFKLKEYCKKNNLKFYSFCFLRGRFMSLYYLLTNSAFRKFGLGEISFEPKASSELALIVSQSKVILDINDCKQQGLTIRTLETLLSNKKMITTNKDIVNYDFYDPDNIFVIDRNSIDIPIGFFKKSYRLVDEKILYKYTAKGWVDDVFGK